MNLEDSRIYKSLTEEPFHKVAKKVLRWTEEGRDVNFRDGKGRSYLHVVAENADKFRDQRAVPVVYQLCVSGINVDAVTVDGDTCLHLVVRREGCYRIVIALLRYTLFIISMKIKIIQGVGSDFDAVTSLVVQPTTSQLCYQLTHKFIIEIDDQ